MQVTCGNTYAPQELISLVTILRYGFEVSTQGRPGTGSLKSGMHKTLASYQVFTILSSQVQFT